MAREIPVDSNGYSITKWICECCGKEMWLTLFEVVKDNNNDGHVLCYMCRKIYDKEKVR